jgi:hypothetical protein
MDLLQLRSAIRSTGCVGKKWRQLCLLAIPSTGCVGKNRGQFCLLAIPSTGCARKKRHQFYQRNPLQVAYVRLDCSYVGDAKNVKDLGCVRLNH